MMTLLSLPEVKGLLVFGLIIYALPWLFIIYFKKLFVEKGYSLSKSWAIAKNILLGLWFILGGALFGIALGGTVMVFYGDSVVFPCLLVGVFIGIYLSYLAIKKRK